MKSLKEQIEKQLELNQGKNLFHQGISELLRFSDETISAIEKLNYIEEGYENFLIDYLTNRALEEFCSINQYCAFDIASRTSLRNLYADLFRVIKSKSLSTDEIARRHYENLIQWLKESNSFAEKIYRDKGETVEPVACSEYSPELQMEILHLDIGEIIQPVLDIGCGREGSLVVYLRERGIEAFGFDRFAFDKPFLYHSDWFEFEFEKNKWGTITSNLGFSNHFKHHHFRKDGDFLAYARKYMDILHALKTGGSFHYAPDLPFIEAYPDPKMYQLTKHHTGIYGFQSTVIKKTSL